LHGRFGEQRIIMAMCNWISGWWWLRSLDWTRNPVFHYKSVCRGGLDVLLQFRLL